MIPHSSSETTSKFKPVSDRCGIALVKLAIDDTPDQSVCMLEDDGAVVGVEYFELLKWLFAWKINCTKLCLDDQGNFVERLGYVDFEWESDAVCTVELLVQCLFSEFDA